MLERFNKTNPIHAATLNKFFADPECDEFFRRLHKLMTYDRLLEFEEITNSHLFLYKNRRDTLAHTALVMVTNYDQASGVAEIGCVVSTRFLKNGVAFRALKELCEQLFYGNLYFQKLTATCLASNARARSLLVRGGFVFEANFPRNVFYKGELREETRYYITNDIFTYLYRTNPSPEGDTQGVGNAGEVPKVVFEKDDVARVAEGAVKDGA